MVEFRSFLSKSAAVPTRASVPGSRVKPAAVIKSGGSGAKLVTTLAVDETEESLTGCLRARRRVRRQVRVKPTLYIPHGWDTKAILRIEMLRLTIGVGRIPCCDQCSIHGEVSQRHENTTCLSQ